MSNRHANLMRIKRRNRRMAEICKHGYPNAYWYNGTRVVRYYQSRRAGSRASYLKRLASKRVRKTDIAFKGSNFKKVFDLKWELD